MLPVMGRPLGPGDVFVRISKAEIECDGRKFTAMFLPKVILRQRSVNGREILCLIRKCLYR
jgi:hypothetical protein